MTFWLDCNVACMFFRRLARPTDFTARVGGIGETKKQNYDAQQKTTTAMLEAKCVDNKFEMLVTWLAVFSLSFYDQHPRPVRNDVTNCITVALQNVFSIIEFKTSGKRSCWWSISYVYGIKSLTPKTYPIVMNCAMNFQNLDLSFLHFSSEFLQIWLTALLSKGFLWSIFYFV